MNIPIKKPKEIKRMRDAGRLVAECFALLEESVKAGVTLEELDQNLVSK